uniref:Mitochondrial carrier protein n=1 Tax=Acrobeloides nanus TaxID=290746 RepID=A0A914CL23_9BILA
MNRNGRFQPAIVKHLSSIIKEEGFRALYKGLIPNLIGVTPSKAIYFYIYSTSKRILNEYWVPNSASVHMASAAFGGFVTATAINPIWLVKTRLQLYRGDISTSHCIKRIYEKSPYSGVFKILGFWKGVSASYLGISETIIQFVIYEYIRNIIDEMHEPDQEKSKLFNFMLAGGTAKFTACVIAYPHEVVRTRLREESAQKRSWISTIGAIYKDGGFRGYYRGLSVQLLRSVPNTAITMGTYETVVYLLRSWFL